MYERMLYDQYKKYSHEELKEITVANGYTEEAEKIAMKILSEREKECGEDRKAQEKAETLAQEDAPQNFDSDMATEQLKKMLYDEYKMYSDEELKEITFANGYTREAEQVARQLLGGYTTEYREDMNAQEEMQAVREDRKVQEAMWAFGRDALPVQGSAMKAHCKVIAWIGSVLGVLYTCSLVLRISLVVKSGMLGVTLLLLTLATGAFVIYVIWVLWHTFAEILEKLDIMGSRLAQMEQQMKKK